MKLKQSLPPAVRKQYGGLNFNEGGAPDRFDDYQTALRNAATKFNVGQVYERPRVTRGGVPVGDNGILPTRNMWYGVVTAILRPVGITAGQTYLQQNAANVSAWSGDTPVDLQPQAMRAAPWRRSVLGAPKSQRVRGDVSV